MGLRLVVGLGNPGSRYAKTRHNVGFRLVERLAGDAPWRDFDASGRYCQARGLILAEPLTFMNESGRFVQALGRFFKTVPGDILVCFDDVALPLGRLRLRPGGSSGGHRGMQSVAEHLGTDDIPRLRVGIGPQPERMASEDFVLQRFTAQEEEALAEALPRAAEAVEAAVQEGLEAAMNKYNKA